MKLNHVAMKCVQTMPRLINSSSTYGAAEGEDGYISRLEPKLKAMTCLNMKTPATGANKTCHFRCENVVLIRNWLKTI
jgi:hypothetical protein